MLKKKLVRIATLPISLEKLLEGQFKFMSNYFEVTIVAADKPQLEKLAASQGVKSFAVPMTRKITPFSDLASVVKLYFFLIREKPHIVHTHTPKAGIVGMVAAKMAGVPIRLHTVAGLPLLEESGIKRKVLNAVEKLTYRAATTVYPNSFGLLDIILENKLASPYKLKVLANGSSNGIDGDYFDPEKIPAAEVSRLKSDLEIKSENFVYIFIGRLVRDKGIVELISAFEELNNRHPQTRLLLLGDYEAELDPLPVDILEKIKNNKAIAPVGFIRDVRPYLVASDVLVFPSYREGFPNVVLQAGAMGLPSIVSDINGCNEIIKNEINGLIIPSKDRQAVNLTMERLYYDKRLYSDLKDKARPMIVERFQRDLVWSAILTEYQNNLQNV